MLKYFSWSIAKLFEKLQVEKEALHSSVFFKNFFLQMCISKMYFFISVFSRQVWTSTQSWGETALSVLSTGLATKIKTFKCESGMCDG